MEKKNFPLGNPDNGRLVKALQVIFGFACIAMALWWLMISFTSELPGRTIYITIVFMAGFGAFLIMAGFGKTTRFIEFDGSMIKVKPNSLWPSSTLNSTDLKQIEIYSLSIILHQKNGKRFIIRFGTLNYETNEKIIDSLAEFAEENGIECTIREDE